MGRSDLFAHAAQCERALHIATDADQRTALKQLRALWLELATQQQMNEDDPETQEAISALKRLHSEIAAAQPTLH
jgi:hypothetical protein